NRLNQHILISKGTCLLLFSKLHEITSGVLLPKILQLKGKIEIVEPEEVPVCWKILLPVCVPRLHTVLYFLLTPNHCPLEWLLLASPPLTGQILPAPDNTQQRI